MNRTKYMVLAITSVIVIALDQWTKYYIHTRFHLGESYIVIPGFFDITYIRNMGAAFGFLHRAPGWFRDPFFIAIPVIALSVILYLFVTLPRSFRWTAFALSLIFSGAIGNLIDRLRFGYVIDFLYFHYREVYYYPAFNVADSAIVVGVALMFLLSFTRKENVGKDEGVPAP